VVGVAEPDRPRGRRTETAEAEQPPDGDAEELARQVVQGAVQRGFRGELARLLAQAALDLLERERDVAEEPRLLPAESPRRGGRLAVVPLGRRLAMARRARVAQLDPDDLDLVPRLARDGERLGELEPGGAGVDLDHGAHAGLRSAGPASSRR